MGKFINPFTDWGFKRIFGQEFSKPLLIDFLNDLLKGERCITDVFYHDKEQLADTYDQRCMIYDIYCTTDTGDHIIVEMQNSAHPFFLDRSICYASRSIIEQVEKGKERTVRHAKKTQEEQLEEQLEADWSDEIGRRKPAYQLLPVYTICFMNFINAPLTKFRTDVVLADREDHSIVSNKLRFIYLTLPLFKTKEEECTTDFDKWIYVLKHMEALERMPFTSQKKVFKALAEYADSHALNREEYEKYQESLWKASENYDYYIDAMKKGFRKGIEEGIEKGREEGIEKGREEGQIGMAVQLLKLGISPEIIARSSSLPLQRIEELKSHLDSN